MHLNNLRGAFLFILARFYFKKLKHFFCTNKMSKTYISFILLKNSTLTLSLMCLVLFFMLPSCRYKLSDAPEKTHVSKINPTIKADPDFDWKMSRDVLFYIKNCQNEVIKITSSNGEILYHKGFSVNKNYDINLNLPFGISQVLINEQLVEITGKAVVFSLQKVKSEEATGFAVCLNGTSGYGEVTNSIISSYPFTMSAWFKPDAVINPNIDQVIFSFGASNNDNKQIGVYLSYSETASGIAAGTIAMRIKSNTPLNLYSDVVAEPGVWYHVAAVYFSKNVRKLYINGILKGTHTANLILPSNLSRFDVGRWADKTPDSYFHGSVDEVKLWNYQRTAAQVLLDMNDTFTGNEPGLIGFWPFEENAGITTADLSTNHRTMMLKNDVQWCFGNNIGDIDLDGIPDEQDDYPEDPLRAFDNYWPPTQATLAFEDLWPSIADYDFNDLVIGYLFKPVTNANNEIVEVFFNFEVKATGAGMQNGFGFSLPDCGIPPDSFLITGFQASNGITMFNANGTESGQTYLTVIPFDIVPKVGNTHFGLPYVAPAELSVKMEITGGRYFINDIGFESFNPFLIVNMVRSHEIHLPDYAPTDLMDFSLFKTRDDASNPPATWYKSFDNLPWGLNFPTDFAYTREKDTLWEGHLKFINWVNAKGSAYTDWFLNEPDYRNPDKIYSHPK